MRYVLPAHHNFAGGHILRNEGTVVWSGGGDISTTYNYGESGTIDNTDGAEFDIIGNANIRPMLSGTIHIVNAGTLRKHDAANSLGTTNFNSTFDNTGLVDVVAGALSLNGGGTGASQFTVESGGTLAFKNDYTLTATSVVAGAGAVRFEAGTVNVNGAYDVEQTDIVGQSDIVGGTARFNGPDATTQHGSLHYGGTLAGTGQFTIEQDFTWYGGILADSGSTVVAAGATFQIAQESLPYLNDYYFYYYYYYLNEFNPRAPHNFADGHTLRNEGTLVWSGSGDISTTYNYGESGTIDNIAGAEFDIIGNANIRPMFSGTIHIINAGTLTKIDAADDLGTTNLYATIVDNTGEVEAEAGTLCFASSGAGTGDFTAQEDGTIQFEGDYTFASDSELSGPGTFQFTAGTVTINGSYDVGNTVIDGGTVAFDGLVANTFDGSMSAGALSGGLCITGAFTWSGGDFQGNTVIDTTGTLNIEDADPDDWDPVDKTMTNATFSNYGTVNWNAEHNIANATGSFTNQTIGVFNVIGDGNFQGTLTFNNNGTYNVKGAVTTAAVGTFTNSSTGVIQVNSGIFEIDATTFNNSGAVQISGDMKIVAGGASSGTFVINGGASLELAGPALTFAGTSSITGEGQVIFTTGQTIAGIYTVGSTIINNVPATFMGAAKTSGSVLLQGANGKLAGSATFTITHEFLWYGGTLEGTNPTDSTIVAAGAVATFSVDPDAPTLQKYVNGRILTLAGTTKWLGGDIRVQQYGKIDNVASGQFLIYCDNYFGIDGTSALWNEGVIKKASDSGAPNVGSGTTVIAGGLFLSPGTLQIDTGCVSISNVTFSGTSSVIVSAEGTLTTTGTQPQQGVRFELGSSYSGTGTFIVDGYLTVDTPLTVANMKLLWKLDGSAALTISNSFTWEGGSILDTSPNKTGVLNIGSQTNTTAMLYMGHSDSNPAILDDVTLDRILNNYGRTAWTSNVRIHVPGIDTSFKNSTANTNAFNAATNTAAGAMQAQLGDARGGFASIESAADANYIDAEEAARGVYEETYADLENEYGNASDAADEYLAAHPDDDDTYDTMMANAETAFDQDVQNAVVAYRDAELAAYNAYQSALNQPFETGSYGLGTNVTLNYADRVAAALTAFRTAQFGAATPALGSAANIQALKQQLEDAMTATASAYGPYPSTRSFLEGLTADTRAALAVAYLRQGNNIETSIRSHFNDFWWDSNETVDIINYLHYGQVTDPAAPATTSLWGTVSGWYNSTTSYISSINPSDVWNSASTMYDNVVTGAANFVVNTATQLRDNPGAVLAAIGNGIVDSNIVVANTFTFGLIPGLNSAADDLVSHNNFYRVVQIGAVIGREFAIGAITGGAANIAIGGAARLLTGTALRMGVSAGRIACMATNAQRIMAPIQAFNNVSTLISNASAIQAAYARGDYETAAVLIARSAGMVRGTVSSLRETGRLVSAGTQALTGNPQAIRNYFTNCFAAGTPILGEVGSWPIEQFRPGDKVWARNENDPDAVAELKPIEECFQSNTEIWHLHVGNQVIRTTSEHPFWVKGMGWTATNELRIGDVLIGKDGGESIVGDIFDTGEVERAYNFRVADHHTYFVGGEDWGFDVWAHNACVIAPIPRRDKNWDDRAAGSNGQVRLLGTPQNTTGLTGNPHADHMEAIAERWAATAPDGSYVVFNRTLRTALGRDAVPSGAGTELRPDLTLVENLGNGRWEVRQIEVRSPGQLKSTLEAHMTAGWGSITADAGKVIDHLEDLVVDIGFFPF